MNSYLYPIQKALIQFPIVAFLLTIPFVLYNYRRYGSISFIRSFVLFSFIFYLQCAFYLVILPLPDPSSVINNSGSFIQLIPFNFVLEFIHHTSFNYKDLSTILIAIKEDVFIQPLFNIFLTMPFGVYLGYYFKQDIRKVFVYSLLLSVFFEVTQLTGIFGFYPKPYRLFDIDDIFLNTLGGVLGYFIHHFVIIFLPSRDQIDEDNIKKSGKISYSRRFVSLVIDFVIVMIGFIFLSKRLYLNNNIILLMFLLYFVVVPSVFKGRTIGKKFVNMKLITVNSNKPLFFHLIFRYGSVYLFIILLQRESNLHYIILVIMISFIIADFIISFKRNKRLWYEILSKTKNESDIFSNTIDQ